MHKRKNTFSRNKKYKIQKIHNAPYNTTQISCIYILFLKMRWVFPTKTVLQKQQADAIGCCTSFRRLISVLVFDILRIPSGFFQNYSGCIATFKPPGYEPTGIQLSPMNSGYLSTVTVTINSPEISVQRTKLYCNILYLRFVLTWYYTT